MLQYVTFGGFMDKIMRKREKIFALIALVVINVLCVVKFLITFVRECKLVDYLSILDYYNDINFGSLDYIKVIMIIGICLTVLLSLISLSLLMIKNHDTKRALLIISITMVLLVIIFYFVSRFICGDYFTVAMFETENYEMLYLYDFAYKFHINAIYMLISLVISLISCFVTFSLSNDFFNKEPKNKQETENNENNEEDVLTYEIKKLKAQIRIKNLESEYLKLKSELDKPTKIGTSKKTQ